MLAACSTDQGPVGVEEEDAGTPDTAPPPKPDAAPPAKHCVQSCTSDQDCQNSCPEVDNGINCCDTATSVCFSSQGSQCPAPVDDAGSPPPVY